MKTLGQILLGVVFALAVCVLVNAMGYAFLDPARIGNYLDLLYIVACICVLIPLILKKRWVSAGTFAFSAFCFFPPVVLFILIVIGCAISQCPVL
jgi:hypothetical protein